MDVIGRNPGGIQEVSADFAVEALATELTPTIDEALHAHGKDQQRVSKLSPVLTVWFVFAMCLRRELNYHAVLDWLLSGLRQLGWNLPRHSVEDGAITHARKRIGLGVIRDVFRTSKEKLCQLVPDFHGLTSMAIDGTTMTMPDTPENRKRFGKPRVGRGKAAFPQLRLVAMVRTALQMVFDVRYGPYCGKGTGERTLGLQLILENARRGILFLLDKGFYGFVLLDTILKKGAEFIVRVPDHVKLERIPKSRMPDGSYLAWLVGKVEDPAGPRPNGQKRWMVVRHKVRVIEYQIKGFRKTRVMTTLLDPAISAKEIVKRYHVRWEIELVYDAIKTHQCATRSGQCRTILRSKRPDLVEQELYAMLAVYNVVRHMMNQAAEKHQIEPLSISFVDALAAIIDAIPGMSRAPTLRLPYLYEQLLDDIARCAMKRYRRRRRYSRVVKVKMSNFRLKKRGHRGSYRDFEAETRIIGAAA
jgi:hypothetical protein